MARVLINFDLPEKYISTLAQKHPDLDFVLCTDEKEIFSYLSDTEVLIVFLHCPRRLIDHAPRLKWIQAISAGVDHLSLDLIFGRGIILTGGRGIHRIHMAEYAIAAMVCLARSFHLIVRNQARRRWDSSPPQGEISGATAGIVGLGEIGEEIAKKASMFDMRVLGVKRGPGAVEHVDEIYEPGDMGAVFEKSDYVINLLPLTSETHRLIDAKFFDLMAPDACFINMGRGKTVNQEDLIKALDSGRIRAMISDVFYQEPLPEDSPLWEMENVIITPHICGRSPNYMKRAMKIIEHNLAVYTGGKGEMMNLVDPDAGY